MENTSYSVLCNMYFQGNVRHDDMATFRTRDYIVEIKREEVEKEFLNVQYKYRCLMIFKDLLGREILALNFNEAQAAILNDNITTFLYNDYSTMMILNNINGPTIFESYAITLEASENELDDSYVLLKVLCSNQITQTTIPILTTKLTLEETDNLLNIAFFIYLIDLVSDRKGIYQI